MIARAPANAATGEHPAPAAATTSKPAPRRAVECPRARTPGVINAQEAYSVAEFRRRCGLGDYAWRQLRRVLPLRRVGKKQFVLGCDRIDYLRRLGGDAQGHMGGENEGKSEVEAN